MDDDHVDDDYVIDDEWWYCTGDADGYLIMMIMMFYYHIISKFNVEANVTECDHDRYPSNITSVPLSMIPLVNVSKCAFVKLRM